MQYQALNVEDNFSDRVLYLLDNDQNIVNKNLCNKQIKEKVLESDHFNFDIT